MSLIGGLKSLQDDLIMEKIDINHCKNPPSIYEIYSLDSIRPAIEVGIIWEKGDNGLGAHLPRY